MGQLRQLIAKPPETFNGGAALGLSLEKDGAGKLTFRRGNTIPEVGDVISRRQLFLFEENWWGITLLLGGPG